MSSVLRGTQAFSLLAKRKALWIRDVTDEDLGPQSHLRSEAPTELCVHGQHSCERSALGTAGWSRTLGSPCSVLEIAHVPNLCLREQLQKWILLFSISPRAPGDILLQLPSPLKAAGEFVAKHGEKHREREKFMGCWTRQSLGLRCPCGHGPGQGRKCEHMHRLSEGGRGTRACSACVTRTALAERCPRLTLAPWLGSQLCTQQHRVPPPRHGEEAKASLTVSVHTKCLRCTQEALNKC